MPNTDAIGFRPLGSAQEVTEGYVVPYYVAELKRRVSIARVEGVLYAFDDLCTHGLCPLSAGMLTGSTILCQCHGCQYDVRTGEVLHGPATRWLPVHEIRETDGLVEVRVAPLI